MKASSGRRALCLIAFSFCFYRLSHILPFKPGQSLIKVLELTLLIAGLLTRRGYCFGRSLAALTERKFKLTHHRNSGHPLADHAVRNYFCSLVSSFWRNAALFGAFRALPWD